MEITSKQLLLKKIEDARYILFITTTDDGDTTYNFNRGFSAAMNLAGETMGISREEINAAKMRGEARSGK